MTCAANYIKSGEYGQAVKGASHLGLIIHNAHRTNHVPTAMEQDYICATIIRQFWRREYGLVSELKNINAIGSQ